MTTRHLVDPQLLSALDIIPQVHFSPETLSVVREQIAEMSANRSAALLDGVSVEEHLIASRDGPAVHVLVARPQGLGSCAPAVLYIHGGAFLLGSAASMQAANQNMAVGAECVVFSVDYRLAPETTHPGPVEDCYTALKWLSDNASMLDIDGTRIAVAGESAGGGLAAALALLARDRAEVRLIHQHLIYPMLDDRTNRTNASPFVGEFVHSPESNVFAWSSLLGMLAGSEGVSQYAAAARADTLAGLPSAFIAVGSLDLFAEENLAYAQRLIRAGVPTELHLYPGAFHGFEMAKDAAVTKQAHAISIAALRLALQVTL